MWNCWLIHVQKWAVIRADMSASLSSSTMYRLGMGLQLYLGLSLTSIVLYQVPWS